VRSSTPGAQPRTGPPLPRPDLPPWILELSRPKLLIPALDHLHLPLFYSFLDIERECERENGRGIIASLNSHSSLADARIASYLV